MKKEKKQNKKKNQGKEAEEPRWEGSKQPQKASLFTKDDRMPKSARYGRMTSRSAKSGWEKHHQE